MQLFKRVFQGYTCNLPFVSVFSPGSKQQCLITKIEHHAFWEVCWHFKAKWKSSVKPSHAIPTWTQTVHRSVNKKTQQDDDQGIHVITWNAYFQT